MICVIGIAGSGKNTQADLLAEKLGCPNVDSGTVLRRDAAGEARRQLEAGELVDDSVMLKLLGSELERIDAAHKEFVWVGSPRSLRQAEWIAGKVKSGSLKYTATIHLELDKATARQRLIKRGREDDARPEVIEQRFAEYDNRMGPVLEFIKKEGLKVINIDASGTIESINKDIMEKLNAS